MHSKSLLYLSVLAVIAIRSTAMNGVLAIPSSASNIGVPDLHPDQHHYQSQHHHHQRAPNIVLTNDDGWAEMNIRAQNDALVKAGYKVLLSHSEMFYFYFLLCLLYASASGFLSYFYFLNAEADVKTIVFFIRSSSPLQPKTSPVQAPDLSSRQY